MLQGSTQFQTGFEFPLLKNKLGSETKQQVASLLLRKLSREP